MPEQYSRKRYYWLIAYCSLAIAAGIVFVAFMVDTVFNGGQLFNN